MASIISDNIISPLGFTTEATCQAILSGKTALRLYESSAAIPFNHTSALFSEEQNQELQVEGFTRFESLAIRSIASALSQADASIGENAILILCSTKGNIELLSTPDDDPETIHLGRSAHRIASYFGLTAEPIVVCNACISGVSGLILGNRLVDTGRYEHAIVCGIDVQNPFVISGFQSLKALSPTDCRPFDIERTGLNLGEAAATIILGREDSTWHISNGAINNDAHHITNPSPTGEGCALSIQHVLKDAEPEALAMINAHGTATMYNDQMESKAICRAGLSAVPMNALKSYLGHTMGAAGVIETIITMKALEEGIIVGTRGFEEIGVSGRVNISPENQATDKTDFIKIISGFGGGNGAILVTQRTARQECDVQQCQPDEVPLCTQEKNSCEATCRPIMVHRVVVTSQSAQVDGTPIKAEETGLKLLTALYKRYVADYPKFYKMDPLARLGFVATEMLLSADGEKSSPKGKCGVVFFNSTGSVHADYEYLKTIADAENFFPSPSLFVYTLPNIVTGEVALYNHMHGETAFYIMPQRNERKMQEVVETTFQDQSLDSLVAGWLEYNNENDFEASIYLITR